MKTVKVFLSCALGAYIGDRVAFQINPAFWWLGLSIGIVVGFIIGYVTYEFKRFASAVPIAFGRAYKSVAGWQPDREVWKLRSQFGEFWLLFVGSTIACWWITLSMGYLDSRSITALLLGLVLAFGSIVGIAMGTALPILTLGRIPIYSPRREALEVLGIKMRMFSLKLNPLFFFGGIIGFSQPIVASAMASVCRTAIAIGVFLLNVLIVCAVIVILVELIVLPIWHFKTILRFFKVFAKTLFRLTHSDLALLCAVDAAIGVTIGYHYHDAILGAIAGGLWGVINFEFVSIRFLKLVPATQSIFRR